MSAPTHPGWWLRVAASIAPAGVREHVESVFEYDGKLWFHDPYRIPKVQPVGDHDWVGEMVLRTTAAPCAFSVPRDPSGAGS